MRERERWRGKKRRKGEEGGGERERWRGRRTRRKRRKEKKWEERVGRRDGRAVGGEWMMGWRRGGRQKKGGIYVV